MLSGMDRRIYGLQRAVWRPDTHADLAWRLRSNAVREQLNRERAERWPVLDADNIREVLRWQEDRYAALMAGVSNG
jgi:hypothetical protein